MSQMKKQRERETETESADGSKLIYIRNYIKSKP